jgi:hypothetical protein
MKIIRVFPRKTKATPTDDLVRVGKGPDLFDEADEIHISVAFTWDLPIAEKLYREWCHVAKTKIGGPALNKPSGEFVPGMYLKCGYVITSRGCPNRCWFCSVPRREGGTVRELAVQQGWNVLDDNLLACSDNHIKLVFSMLEYQRMPISFTGGLEAARLKPWHVEALKKIPIKQLFFAYDEQRDRDPLFAVGEMLKDAGFPIHPHSHMLRCFVLCGYPGDTIQAAESRMQDTLNAGFTPMAMVWRDETGRKDHAWGVFQRQWTRPAIIYAKRR